MRLENTKDKLNYIYGNTARKIETDYHDYYSTSPLKPQPVEEEKVKPKRQPRVKVEDRFDSRYTFMISLALGFMAIAAFLIIFQSSRMNQYAHQEKVLKTEKAELQSKQVSIQSEIDKAVNLDKIRQYAEENLNMVYPDHNSVIYYNQDSSDYFRQYESMDK